MIPPPGGIEIVVSTAMVEMRMVPYPRSPARARRRARLGHKQHQELRPVPMKVAYQMPDGRLVMHPDLAAQIRAAAARRPEGPPSSPPAPAAAPPPHQPGPIDAAALLGRMRSILDGLAVGGMRRESFFDRFIRDTPLA